MALPPGKKNPKAAMQAEFLDKMAMPGPANPDMEGDMAMPTPEDIDEETETETAAPSADLSSIPDALLEAELAKRKKASAAGAGPAPAAMPPAQDDLSII